MELEELKEKLSKINDPTLTDAIVELVESERAKGIAEVQKRNKENQSLRKFKTMLEETGIQDEDELRELLSSKKETKTSELSLKSLKAELDRVKAERDNERLLGKKKTLEAELTNAIGDKVFGSKYLIKSLISDGVVDMVDGEMVFKYDGEHIAFNDGVKRVLDENKDSLRTNINGGSKTIKSDAKPSNLESIMKSNDTDAIRANFADIAKELGLKL